MNPLSSWALLLVLSIAAGLVTWALYSMAEDWADPDE